MKYVWNCVWLLVPIVWMNLALAGRLPEMYQAAVFWRDVPWWIAVGENITRVGVVAVVLCMPLQIANARQRAGLAAYSAGVVVYFLSWAMQIWFPGTPWSRSLPGFLAPAYTPAVWLGGIGLIGERLYFGRMYRPWMFLALSLVFLAFHNAHAWTVYSRVHPWGIR